MGAFALKINAKDNVAVVLSGPVPAGEDVEVRDRGGSSFSLKSENDIPFGHKIALCQIGAGEHIVKYGEVIGAASMAIMPGQHVHIHNMDSLRARGDLEG